MARFSTTHVEQQHLDRIYTQMPPGGIVTMILKGGITLEGALRSNFEGNNGGEGGVWQNCGECRIEDKSRKQHIVDYLDIEEVIPMNDEYTLGEYHKLGLIQLVRR